MQQVVLKLGSHSLKIRKSSLGDNLECNLRTSVQAWLDISDDDWDTCKLTIASQGNSEACYCTPASKLYNEVRSWLDGVEPANDVKSPMVVSVVAAPKRGTKKAPSAAASGATAASSDKLWNKLKGSLIHVSSDMQKAVQAADKKWYKDIKGVKLFIDAPPGSFLQSQHETGLNIYAGRVRRLVSCLL